MASTAEPARRLPGLVRFVPVLLATALLAACAATGGGEPPQTPAASGDTSEQRAARYFEEIRDQPPLVTAFVTRMPKGADLHNHVSGAVYAESYIAWAVQDGLCVDKKELAIAPAPCAGPELMPAAQVPRNGPLYGALINSLSMRGFVPGPQTGHDHFFAAFDKFSAAGARRGADMIAEVAERAGEENTDYLELMTSPGMGAARKIGAAVGWSDDLAAMRAKMLAAGLGQIVPAVQHDMDGVEQAERQQLGCAAAAPKPGCRVTVRYLAQVIRTFPPEQVFAQFLLAFALIEADPRFVGLNLVAPEDDPVALRDYDKQMRMLGFLGKNATARSISLHAGELTLGLVPPEQLRFHIRDAVEVAGARRIGHGVDIFYEDNALGLLAEMAKRHVLVEINLTSNDQILGVRGEHHPFMTYRRFGVPVALSTDDEGVSRINLSHEYERAALTYRLTYPELKALARNSLEYSFLPGESLWRSVLPFAPASACADGTLGQAEPAPACREFLAQSEKARLQWRLEGEFSQFEASAPAALQH